MNTNDKWQKHSDDTFTNPARSSVIFIPQLFYLSFNIHLVLGVAKASDDILIGGNSKLICVAIGP